MKITTKKFFEIAGIDTSTGKAKILIESSESQFFVTLISPNGDDNSNEHIGSFNSLDIAHKAILQHARKHRIIPDVVSASDMHGMIHYGNVWEVGADEVSYLIKVGSWPSSADYS